jgi:hypothetical protein
LRLLRASIFVVSALAAAPGAIVAADAPDGPRDVAEKFGAALTSSRAASLRPLLPSQGKVRLCLRRLGPEDGSFAAGQVEAVFANFLASGSVRVFALASVDTDGRTAALAVASAEVVDREGRPVRIGLRFSLEPEGDRWIVREVRETPE